MSSPIDPAPSGVVGTPSPAGVRERAERLADALAALGVRVRVEADGAGAVLVPAGDSPADWPALRREAVRLARLHGFSHVALDLGAADA